MKVSLLTEAIKFGCSVELLFRNTRLRPEDDLVFPGGAVFGRRDGVDRAYRTRFLRHNSATPYSDRAGLAGGAALCRERRRLCSLA